MLMTGWQDDRMTWWQDDTMTGTPDDMVTKWLSDRVTEWPSDRVTKWPSDRVTEYQVTEWPSDPVTEWTSDRVTGSFADDWLDGIFIFIYYTERVRSPFGFSELVIWGYLCLFSSSSSPICYTKKWLKTIHCPGFVIPTHFWLTMK